MVASEVSCHWMRFQEDLSDRHTTISERQAYKALEQKGVVLVWQPTDVASALALRDLDSAAQSPHGSVRVE